MRPASFVGEISLPEPVRVAKKGVVFSVAAKRGARKGTLRVSRPLSLAVKPTSHVAQPAGRLEVCAASWLREEEEEVEEEGVPPALLALPALEAATAAAAAAVGGRKVPLVSTAWGVR